MGIATEMASAKCQGEIVVYLAVSLLANARTLRTNSDRFERAWRDLRRRDLLFRAIPLSFVPCAVLIIVVLNAMYGDVPREFGRWVGGGWIAAFFAAGAYRRRFRCPHCSELFFGRGLSNNSARCAHCQWPAHATVAR